MDDLSKAPYTLGQQGGKALDKGIDAAQDAIAATILGTQKTAARAETAVEDVQKEAAPLLDHAGDKAERLVGRGQDARQSATRSAPETWEEVSGHALSYTREQSVKALLLAAAAGAVLMALLVLTSRSRH